MSKLAKVAINGFGRIGRLAFRANLEDPKFEVVAINNPGSTEQLAHLLKYDSTYGQLKADLKVNKDSIEVNGKKIMFYNSREPEELPWKSLDIDIVLECTGIFKTHELASKHLKAGAKKVLVSAPGKGVDATFCYGVNHKDFNFKKHVIVSNASCTTNALAPLCQVINNNFEIKSALMTTIHSMTASQNIVDGSHKKDSRRARTASASIIPTTTGATKAVEIVLPELKGKLQGMVIRVPTTTVSLVDVTFELKKAVSVEEVTLALEKAANSTHSGILGVSHEPLVSVDYKGNAHSSVIDAELTKVSSDGHLVKILTWYDNEWGYASKLNEMTGYMGSFF